MNIEFWKDKRVIVTGGASFIGSNLLDRLYDNCSELFVVDNFRTGKNSNIDMTERKNYHIIKDDAENVFKKGLCFDGDIVFHLAAYHGGRGFIDGNESIISKNFSLDNIVFQDALRANVGKIVYASTGCVYPESLQDSYEHDVLLKEFMVGPPYDADRLYGWTKLMGELTLKAMHKEHGLKYAACRLFTVYGPRGLEDHAVIALIAKAFIRQNPIEIWGNGNQFRNWTYVDDIVDGLILAAESDVCDSFNLGTDEKTTINDAVKAIIHEMNFQRTDIYNPELKHLLDKPVGVLNRSCSYLNTHSQLGWSPKVSFNEGLRRTIEWYINSHSENDIRNNLESLLKG